MKFLKKMALAYAGPEVVEAKARELHEVELRQFREIVRSRRAGTPTSNPLLAVIHLINEVERMEQLKNGYADIVWDLVREWPEGAVAAVKAQVGKLEGRFGLPPYGG